MVVVDLIQHRAECLVLFLFFQESDDSLNKRALFYVQIRRPHSSARARESLILCLDVGQRALALCSTAPVLRHVAGAHRRARANNGVAPLCITATHSLDPLFCSAQMHNVIRKRNLEMKLSYLSIQFSH